MSKLVRSVALALLVLLVVFSVLVSAKQPIVVVDALGRSVELPSIPKRVVSIAPSITQILANLGLLDVVVGVDSFSIGDWYLNISSRLRERGVVDVGGYWWSVIKVEEILKLNPDIVLADSGAHRPLLETFESYNVTVVYLHGGSAKSVNDVLSDIYTIGLVFNETSRAESLVNEITSALDEGLKLLKPFSGRRILVVIDFWQGIWVVGKATFIDDVFSRLGLINAATTYGWSAVSIETISKWNPDIIIVACSYATNETIREAGLYDLGKPIVLLNNTEIDIISRPGPLITLIPQVLYTALERGLGKPVETVTPTTPLTTTITVTETKTTTITTPIVQVVGLEAGQVVVITVIVAILAFIIGLTIGLKRRRS
jgi:iron complex transport system substrate-binding protein